MACTLHHFFIDDACATQVPDLEAAACAAPSPDPEAAACAAQVPDLEAAACAAPAPEAAACAAQVRRAGKRERVDATDEIIIVSDGMLVKVDFDCWQQVSERRRTREEGIEKARGFCAQVMVVRQYKERQYEAKQRDIADDEAAQNDEAAHKDEAAQNDAIAVAAIEEAFRREEVIAQFILTAEQHSIFTRFDYLKP